MKKSNWFATGFGRFVSPELVSDEFLDAEVVIFLEGKNVFGDHLYCYLQLTCANLKEIFRKMQAGQDFKPADFGTTIFAGRGVPSPETLAEIHNEYNIIDVPKPKPPFKIDTTQPVFYDEDRFFE